MRRGLDIRSLSRCSTRIKRSSQYRLLSIKSHPESTSESTDNSVIDAQTVPQKKSSDNNQRFPSLLRKVEQIINVAKGEKQPRYLACEIECLMKECSTLSSSEEGSRNTVKLLHRLLEEKRHANQVFIDERKEDDTISSVPYIINDSFFHLAMFAQIRTKDGVRNIQDLIQLMTDEYRFDSRSLLPSIHVEGWIDKREKRVSCRPSTTTYNILLAALVEASHNKPRFAATAEKVLDKMRTLQKHKKWHTMPNTKSYQLVIEAYSRNNTFDAGSNAVQVYNKMVAAHEQALQEYRNHSITGVDYNFNDPSGNYRHIVAPTTKAILSVIDAYLHSNTEASPKVAESFLLTCIKNKVTDKLNIINGSVFHRVILGWSRRMSKIKNPRVRFDAASKAEKLMRRMENLTSSNPKMSHCAPTIETYNLCLNAWAQSDVKESAKRASALFEELVNHDDIGLDLSSCHCLMTAISRSFPYDIDSAQEVEKVLDKVSMLHNLGHKNEYLEPTQLTYSIAINAWAKAKKSYDVNGIHKAIHTRRLLDVLLEKHANGKSDKPSIHVFTSVLNACTFPAMSDSKDVVEVAIKTYEDVLNDERWLNITPDQFLFANMIKAINVQMMLSKSSYYQRLAILERIHKDAKNAECVTPRVMKELREACSEDELRSMLGNDF
jgi:hypothetical protein